MMILLGTFQAIEGFVAIFDDGYYGVTEGGLVINVDYTVWGWTHLLLGVLIVIAGIGVLAGNLAARTVAVLLAGLSAIANMLFIAGLPHLEHHRHHRRRPGDLRAHRARPRDEADLIRTRFTRAGLPAGSLGAGMLLQATARMRALVTGLVRMGGRRPDAAILRRVSVA